MKLTTNLIPTGLVGIEIMLKIYLKFDMPLKKVNHLIYNTLGLNIPTFHAIMLLYIYIVHNSNHFKQQQVTDNQGITNRNLQKLILFGVILRDPLKKTNKYYVNPLLLNGLAIQVDYILNSTKKKLK